MTSPSAPTIHKVAMDDKSAGIGDTIITTVMPKDNTPPSTGCAAVGRHSVSLEVRGQRILSVLEVGPGERQVEQGVPPLFGRL